MLYSVKSKERRPGSISDHLYTTIDTCYVFCASFKHLVY